MADSDPDIKSSPRSGPVTVDGVTVLVKIYRLAHLSEGWILEVVDHEGGSTVWEEAFATDEAAYKTFVLAVEIEGIRSFADAPVDRMH